MSEPEAKGPEKEPGEATADQGIVLLDGPDGVAVAMNAAAARLTGERLIAAAGQAGDQAGAEGTPDG